LQLKATLNGLYKSACCTHTSTFKMSGGIEKDLAAMVQRIWKEKGMPDTIDKAVAEAFFKELWGGVTDGFEVDEDIDYETADSDMLDNLKNNVYQFSAAKNYQQLKSLTEALVDENGIVRSFSQFKKAAFTINDEHVNQWLKVEYNTAIASGQMASKWVGIEANKRVLPFLSYDAVIDGNTSDICLDFNGIVRPVDDAFWDEFYPPNHYGCRSTVRQLSDGTSTNIDNLAIPEKIPDMFKVNLAKRGLAFPKGHPYFIGTPQDVLDALIDD
jgi:SPP1 gp7 family putative phage head morphogenesis protein